VNPLNKRSRRAAIALGLLATLGAVPSALAQTALTLPQAIARARTQNPDAGSAAAAEREAAQRVAQARAGYLPKVDVVESWQRGDQPVFVFSSLLGQRQFTADDFSLAALNHPQALDNFRSAITVEQALFDGTTRANVAAAGLGHTAASVNRLRVDQDLAASVTAAYGRVLATAAAAESAAAAVETAQADRDLSGNRRAAGLVTDADVLQLDVYVSQTRERQIRASSDERIARAELNQLMGEPLDALFVLDRFPGAVAIDVTDLTSLQAEALENRPDVKLAALQEEFAGVAHTAARAAFLPQVSVQGGWEFNGGTWGTRASSWVVGAVARINLFRGFGDKARLAEAEEQAARRALESEKARTSAALAVHIAAARLEAARASEAVGRAAVAQARESQRIVRDRYEAGLTDVASLLRAAEVVVQAEAQQTAAQVAVLTETAALERSLGRR
jgi:outer membrane protein TolC